ncbi:hypothetical protein [Parafrankia sp. EUN1f]|uniref:hypothetical protein n=1 Tax=Parafrankia sp. EUN1f TaxID=102897 RepID=UPI0001C442D8|nr:hypothetical protein [Parafrankia sp. EUN1f]EFC84873.1 hypothetical protein FrEUN1fDRAFT_2055 [Parafrankia sp. EUN1f]
MARRSYDLHASGIGYRTRGSDFRTWDQLSRQERRTGLTMLAAIGVVAVVAVWLLVGDETSVGAETGAAAPPTVDVSAELDAWYESTATERADVVKAATDVRTYISAKDGLSLQPACVTLGEAAQRAAAVTAAPDQAAHQAWSDGAAGYTSAAAVCGNLFDGTKESVASLLGRTTAALDTADGTWTRLAADLGQPAQTVQPASGG